MEKTVIKKNETVILPNAETAATFFERFRGLMFAEEIPDSYGLVIKPCRQIHMFNMKFPLDVIYLSEDDTVVDIDEDIRPWKIGRTVKAAAYVIEVNAGFCARNGIVPGDRLSVQKKEASRG